MNTRIVSKEEIIKKDVKILLNKSDILISNTIRNIAYEHINLYWHIGKIISNYKKEHNSSYGDSVVRKFSEVLYSKYGSGFSKRNIYRAIEFYELFPKVSPATKFKNNCKITWSHIIEILKINDTKEFKFYLYEVYNKGLNKKELRTYVGSRAYERTISNQRKGKMFSKLCCFFRIKKSV